MQQKKYSLIITLLLLTNSFCYAQTVTQVWATLESFAQPLGIAIDASGNVFTANGTGRLSKITPTGTVTNAWANLNYSPVASGIKIDASGNVFTVNQGNSIVTKITPSGTITQAWASLGFGTSPNSMAIDASGNVFTANNGGNVSKITSSGSITQSWAFFGNAYNPIGIAIDASGNVFTANNTNNTVSKITPSGAVTLAWATLTAIPIAIAIDASGNVFTINNNNTVSKITSSGIVTQAWATLTAIPSAIAIDASGNVYTANSNNNTVSKITSSGIVTQAWASLLSGASPRSIAIDASGNVYTANSGTNTISKITATAVPLKLINFTASKQDKTSKFQWQTTNEINTSHFIIQRSIDGISFTTIGQVNAKGGGVYNFTGIQLPTANKLYYRLQIIDKDGSFTYSPIAIINLSNKGKITISPNPASNYITVSGNAIKMVQVFDNTGKVILTSNTIGVSSTLLPIHSLSKGLYQIKILKTNGEIEIQKFMKE